VSIELQNTFSVNTKHWSLGEKKLIWIIVLPHFLVRSFLRITACLSLSLQDHVINDNHNLSWSPLPACCCMATGAQKGGGGCDGDNTVLGQPCCRFELHAILLPS
jgi:hypothetical protein